MGWQVISFYATFINQVVTKLQLSNIYNVEITREKLEEFIENNYNSNMYILNYFEHSNYEVCFLMLLNWIEKYQLENYGETNIETPYTKNKIFALFKYLVIKDCIDDIFDVITFKCTVLDMHYKYPNPDQINLEEEDSEESESEEEDEDSEEEGEDSEEEGEDEQDFYILPETKDYYSLITRVYLDPPASAA